MPNEQGKNLMRIYERAVAVDSADAVAIAIGTERRIVFTGAHGLAGGFDVRLDGLGINSRESRVARTANFVPLNALAGEQLPKQARRRPIHPVAEERELRRTEALPIHPFFHVFWVGRPRL